MGWETVSEDKAATCFARGFYDALGAQFEGTRLIRRVSIADAYAEALRAFSQGGYRVGDPAKSMAYPRADVVARSAAAGDGDGGDAVQYEVRLRATGASERYPREKRRFATGVLTLHGAGRAETATVMGVADDPGETFAVGSMVHIMSFDETPVRLKPMLYGTPGLFAGIPARPSMLRRDESSLMGMDASRRVSDDTAAPRPPEALTKLVSVPELSHV